MSFIYNSKVKYSKVSKVLRAESLNIVIINAELETTLGHRFWTPNGWKKAGSLQIGDLVITEHGYKLISSIEYNKRFAEVYNIELFGLPQYYANGYLVHNWKP